MPSTTRCKRDVQAASGYHLRQRNCTTSQRSWAWNRRVEAYQSLPPCWCTCPRSWASPSHGSARHHIGMSLQCHMYAFRIPPHLQPHCLAHVGVTSHAKHTCTLQSVAMQRVLTPSISIQGICEARGCICRMNTSHCVSWPLHHTSHLLFAHLSCFRRILVQPWLMGQPESSQTRRLEPQQLDLPSLGHSTDSAGDTVMWVRSTERTDLA